MKKENIKMFDEKVMDNSLRVGIISDVHIGFNGHNDPKYFGHYGKIGYYGKQGVSMCLSRARSIINILPTAPGTDRKSTPGSGISTCIRWKNCY